MNRKSHPLLLALAFAGLWWLLSGGHAESWILGIPAVLAASWAAHRLGTGRGATISVSGAMRFLPVFVWESLRGGTDVARRTLAARLRVRPGFADYQTALGNKGARVFFANCVCLLPGTLAADLRGNTLRVHLLDSGADPHSDLQRLEQAVALVYGQGGYKRGASAP